MIRRQPDFELWRIGKVFSKEKSCGYLVSASELLNHYLRELAAFLCFNSRNKPTGMELREVVSDSFTFRREKGLKRRLLAIVAKQSHECVNKSTLAIRAHAMT